MNGGSIRFRLILAAAVSIVFALAIAGLGLVYLFERHVERRVEAEMSVDLNQLIGRTSFSADGKLMAAPLLSDPRFEAPLSGYYWQVEDTKLGTTLRSRSLWDTALTLLDQPAGNGLPHMHEIAGPGGALLVVVERTIVDGSGRSFRAMVAESHQSIEAAIGEYIGELVPALVLLAVVLLAANFIQIGIGVAPLEKLLVAVRDVASRKTHRLTGRAPSEVQPLVDEINRMLDVQEEALVRARSRAADLAHGLKTPLQVISADVRALRAKGEFQLAEGIEKSASAIQHHVERELARTRVAPGEAGPAECRVREVAGNICAVVARTPKGSKLRFIFDIAAGTTAPIDEGDLAEILGNLIDNASRFARSTIRVRASNTEQGTELGVSDDGPGIAETDKNAALSRGVRLDTAEGGDGLGLAIVADIVGAYGGVLRMRDSGPGLLVEISLPRPTRAARLLKGDAASAGSSTSRLTPAS